jgi:hypothetical protein
MARVRRYAPAALVAAVVLVLWIALSGHRTPAGQPPLTDLTATLQQLQDDFNSHANATRVILLLSPT